MYIVLGSMYETMSISTGLYPNLDLWNANKLHYITHSTDFKATYAMAVSKYAVKFRNSCLASFLLFKVRALSFESHG